MKQFISVLLLLGGLHAAAQISPETIRRVILDDHSVQSPGLSNEKLVTAFYEINRNQLAWMREEDAEMRSELFTLLNSSADYGLNKKDYQYETIQSIQSVPVLTSALDSILADIRLTDAAIGFFSEIRNGNKSPVLSYNGINYQPYNMPVVLQLVDFCARQSLKGLLKEVEPRSKEYGNAITILRQFNKVMNSPGFAEATIKSNKVEITNVPLLLKLFQLGVVDSATVINHKALVSKLQKAQRMLGVLNDGVLRSTSLSALNVPIWQRREEIILALNNIRWLEGMRKGDAMAILNIPSATLHVYKKDSLVLYSRAVVGKPATPTPTLSSKIVEVIAYPYWIVPYSIAARELLPSIKEDIGFLEANNFQVMNKQGKILDPFKIDWKKLSTANFPYTIRQSTGCDNALGVLKFNFASPFSVYLHDTPDKGLFFMNKRYFSHGCMRIEKPVELAQLLLGEKASDIDSLTKQCLRDQKPWTVAVPQPLALVVLYSTAWYNEQGEIQFFEDAYHKLPFERSGIAKY